MGGLSRKSHYVKSLKNKNADPIVLDAGDALFTRPVFPESALSKERFKAEKFLKGFEKIGCDALNIGQYDLVGGYEFLKKLSENSEIPFLSANLINLNTQELAFEPYVILVRNNLKVGVIGVTDFIPEVDSILRNENYLDVGKKYIKKLKNKADIIVILVNGKLDQKSNMLGAFADADYIYLSGPVRNQRPTNPQKEGFPIFYTNGVNGKILLETTCTIVDKNEPLEDVSAYAGRLRTMHAQIKRLSKTEAGQSLSEKYVDNPAVLRQIEMLNEKSQETELKLGNIVNASAMQIVQLSPKMPFDKEMQEFIDQSIKEYKSF